SLNDAIVAGGGAAGAAPRIGYPAAALLLRCVTEVSPTRKVSDQTAGVCPPDRRKVDNRITGV
ncbi:MAG: hypothetical protein ACJ731_11075, partial [Vicinamibacterales bacterium]